MRITLGELLDLFDYERTSGMIIQICDDGGDWNDYDEVSTKSSLLHPFERCKVKEASVVDAGVIRVDIDWSDAK